MKKMKRILAIALTVMLVSSSAWTGNAVPALAAEGGAESNDNIVTEEKLENSGSAEDEESADSSSGYADFDDLPEADDGGVDVGDDIYDEGSEAVEESSESAAAVEEVDRSEIDVDLTTGGIEDDPLSELTPYDDDEMVKVIIEFEGDSVIEANSSAEPNTAYSNYKTRMLEKTQTNAIAQIEDEVMDGEELEVDYQYTWLINAIATEVPYGTISEIEELSKVEKVYIQEQYDALTTDGTDEILTYTSGSMIGKSDTWDLGYTGEDVTIAIIDTGLDTDHPSFAALSEEVVVSATEDTVSSVLDSLNASERYEGLTVDDVYLSSKVPFAFNYCDDNLDVTHENDTQGDHGTHVAGITAANALESTEVVGVAPDAQLYVMKVFGQNGGAWDEDILAALEDSLKLDADVINMSLGSTAGFSTSGDSVMDEVYASVSSTDTILAIAGGNSYTLGYYNLQGYDSSLTTNPDNGVVSSPGTYSSALSVASVENSYITAYYIEVNGEKITYSEGQSGGNAAMSTLYGQTLEFVLIDGYGEESDYEGVDVSGKVAVVSRGTTTFSAKTEAAEAAGAVACLVYNNVTGETFTADLSDTTATIPMATITLSQGETLKAAAEAGITEVYFSDETASVENPSGYQMNTFSSWGTTSELAIEPDITAPGGDIYSTLDGGTYGLMSGTSMASPQVAGISALAEQYVEETTDLADSDVHDIITALLLSTATPLSYDEETYYSPRQQGSGLANAELAVTSKAYLKVDGETEPQIELGDDAAKTGSYTYSFDVVNFGDTSLYYDIATTVQTEDYVDYDGVEYMSSTPVNLDADTSASGSAVVYTYDYDEDGATHSHDARQAYLMIQSGESISDDELFRYDLTGDDGADEKDVQAYLDALVGNNDLDLSAQTVCVKAGSSATVNVTVEVSSEGKAWMDAHYSNGIYVEGFTVLKAKSVGGVDLSLPYLAFYGDWESAPVIDGGYYYMSNEDLAVSANQYYNILWSNYAGEEDYWTPGVNPYLDEDEADPDHISISPNGDGYDDSITDIYVSMLRNAAKVNVTFANAETGEEYVNNTATQVTKSYYYSGYGVCIPFIYSGYVDDYLWEGTDADGETLANNTEVTMSISAYLTEDSKPDVWEETITIDTEAPVLDEDEGSTFITINDDGTQTLTMTFSDNVDVAAVNFVTRGGSVIDQVAVDQPETKGDTVTAEYDITGYGNTFYVILGDYAMNESSYLITTTDNLPVLDTDLLYGFRVNDEAIYDDTLFGWVSMNTDEENFETTVLDSEYYIDYAITAAAYADGTIFAVAADNQLYAITPGLWDEWTWISDVGVSIRTMTFDPTTGYLYGYSSSQYALYRIDPLTGETTKVSTTYVTTLATALACDDEGTLYGITTGGILRTMNKETGKWTVSGEDGYLNVSLVNDFKEQTGLTYTSFGYAQSMVYDSEEGCLYWAAYSIYGSYYRYGGLVRLEVNEDDTVGLTVLGEIEGNAEMVGLLKLEDRGEFTIPEVDELTDLAIDPESISLLQGNTATLTAKLTPWYADNVNLVWTSDDESVATVDANGRVTAVGVGEATVTVANDASGLSAECKVSVVNPNSELTGFVIADNLYYQWTSFAANDLDNYEVVSEEGYIDVSAAEYYDGYVYIYDAVGNFYRADPNDGYAMTKIGEINDDASIIDMSYDYSSGFMYALAQDSSGYSYLYTVDLMTGRVDTLGYGEYMEDSYYGEAVAMAVDLEGTIYYITGTGFLCTYDLETHSGTDIGLTGASVTTYIQSMTFDHSTGELYWAGMDGLYYVDIATGAALNLGLLDSSTYTEIIGLHSVPDESILPERDEVAVEAVSLTADSVTVLEGMSTTIPVEVLPYNATDRTVTWSVEDDSIASIADGQVIGLAAGTTTVTGTLGDFSVTFTVHVVASAGTLTGYVLYDQGTSGGYFWGSFNDYDLSSGEALAASDGYTVYAGEYYDGNIYAYGLDDDTWTYIFMEIDADTYEINWSVDASEYPAFFEMAFDYSTGTLYAVGQPGGVNSSGNSYLYMIDTATGAYYTVGQSEANIYALACAEDGTMYAIATDGCLYTMDKTTAALKLVGYTGYDANQYQSLAFDYDTGNLYWAQCGYDSWSWAYTMDFLLVNTDDGTVTKLGTIGTSGCQVVSLYSVPDKEMEIGEYVPTGVALNSTQATLSAGDTLQLTASLTPISVNSPDGAVITYTSSDESVATVNSDGLITAVGRGSATITATCEGVSGTCSVTVVDDSVVFYAAYADGFDVSAVYSPGKVTASVSYPEEMAEMALSAYSADDDIIYSVDTDGYLWSYRYEDGAITDIKQSENTILSGLTELESPGILDLTVNVFNNTLYAMVRHTVDDDGWLYYAYSICTIDTETAEATVVGVVSENIPAPTAFVFTKEDYLLVYDSYADYIYGQTLSTDDYAAVDQLAWVQSDFYFGGGSLALVYSESMNRVFLYGEDWYSGYGLYEFNLSSYSLSLVGTTAYNTGTFDLLLME